jgi:hypothetical protein
LPHRRSLSISRPLKRVVVEAAAVVAVPLWVVAAAVAPAWGAADTVPVWRSAALQWEVGLVGQVWEEGLRCTESSMRHRAHTQEAHLLAVASLRRPVNRSIGTPELMAAGNGTAVIGSIRVIIIMATTIVTMGMGLPFSEASMTMDTTLIIPITIATSGAAYTRGMDGDGIGFMSAIIDTDNFGCPLLA